MRPMDKDLKMELATSKKSPSRVATVMNEEVERIVVCLSVIRLVGPLTMKYVSSEMLWEKMKDIDSKEINFSSHRYAKSLWSIFFIIYSKYNSFPLNIFIFALRDLGFMFILLMY